MSYDPRYLQGIEYFNECEFFEAHEVWKDLWQDTGGGSRGFYQGLIQVAVCLHHFGNGNTRGAAKLYHSSRKYLDPFAPSHEGLDIEAFLQQLHVCCQPILDSVDQSTAEIEAETIPEIHLVEADPTAS